MTKAAGLYLNAPGSVLTNIGVKPVGRYNKALDYLLSSMKIDTSDGEDLHDKYHYLSQVYQHLHNYQLAYHTSQRYIALKDSLDAGNAEVMKFNEKMNGYDEAKKEEASRYQQNLARLHYEQQKKYYLVGLIALAVIAFFIFFNYFNQRKANRQITAVNHQLSEQQEEITVQRDQLSESLTQLKATQTQLIQTEKMASLGELTAGIAHEIQNPLNFVNNFSDVNREMLEELKAEREKPKAERDDQLETDLINDLINNEQKINHHGKRADSIVKGMLEHSRASTGQKEKTDLNKLADEYLHLAYHGLRSKDKLFNADLTTHFDENLPPVNVIPQDIGRVLLNLFNNAFYAVNEKKKTAGDDYTPTVTITTFAPPPGGWGATVADNGNGIQDAVVDKIFQPFFTTKPTGEGTGLGLSLAYDIVKAHGGEIKVQTKAGEGTMFTLLLPA